MLVWQSSSSAGTRSVDSAAGEGMDWFDLDQLGLKFGIGVLALVVFFLFSLGAALVLRDFERVTLWFSRREARPTASGSPETSAADRLNDAGDLAESCTFLPPRVGVVAAESPLGELGEVGKLFTTGGSKVQK